MAPGHRGRNIALLTVGTVVVVLTVMAWQYWPHIQFWWRFEAMGKNEQGFPEYKHRQTGIVMVKVPGGTFWMGAQKEDLKGQNYDPNAKENQGPVHRVTLSPFLIAKFEVSQAEWEKIMGNNPSEFIGKKKPVENVSWDDCKEFCMKTGLNLSSESQWEYSCRAGTTGPYARNGNPNEMGWYDVNSGNITHPVGQKKPNQFGLHDMQGNVWEWCEDVYDGYFYSKPIASAPDPVATEGSGCRVIRGGSWSEDARCGSSAFRLGVESGIIISVFGFRPCFSCPP